MNRHAHIISRRRLLAGSGGALALLAGSGGRRRPAAIERLGTTSTPAGTILNVAARKDPPGFDPQAQPNVATTSLAGALFSGLLRCRLDADPQASFRHDPEPSLVARWESVDLMTWVLHLRPDATFMNIPPVNGHAVEAEDVRASLDRAAQAAKSQRRAVASMFDASVIETPDPQTVQFRLPQPYLPLPWFLASLPDGLVQPREAAAGSYDPNQLPIGSGPFSLASYDPGDVVELQRNPAYYEPGQPALDGVRQAIVPSEDDQVAQFSAGTLDLIRVGPQAASTAIAQNPAAQVVSAAADANFTLFFQLGAPSLPFGDIRLRQAVSEAIDRDAIAKTLYGDQYDFPFAVNLSMGPWALHRSDLDPSLQRWYTYNPADASLLLRASGYEGSSVTLAYPSGAFGPEFDSLAQSIATYLAALNWNVTLAPIDYVSDYLGNGNGARYGNIPSGTMLLGRVPSFTNIDQYLFDLYYSRSPGNIEHVANPMLDAMIDHARTIADPRQLQAAYLDVQKYIAGQMFAVAGLPIGYRSQILQPWVQSYAYAPEATTAGRSWRTISISSAPANSGAP